MKKFSLIAGTVLLALLALAPAGRCEQYPSKPVNIVVAWGAGGTTDIASRILADAFKDILGQPMVVLNKPGGSGIVGLNSVLNSKPDGYTIVSGPLTSALTSPYFLGSDPIKPESLSFVGSYMPQERILLATPGKPYNTLQEFIAYVRANPGKVSVGSGAAQWGLEVMKSIAVKEKLNMKYVMFKSGADATASVMGEHVDVCELGVGSPGYQAAREGKLKVLVDLGAERIPFFEKVPNVHELGYPFTTLLEYGFAVPAGTPEPIRQKLEDTLRKAIANPAVLEKMKNLGLAPRFLTGAQYKKICVDAVNSIPNMINYNKALEK